jgi:hypothetical protein
MTVCGIRYGSLELPVIAEYLYSIRFQNIEKKDKIFEGSIASMPDNYIVRHEKQDIDETHMFEMVPQTSLLLSDQAIHILSDDNLLTGKTMQIVINALLNKKIFLDKLIVVRYPTLNRIEHMFSKDTIRAPDTTLFFDFILGLISPVPYSKLNKRNSYTTMHSDIYKDQLGVFNKSRERMVNYLYKNKKYKSDSKVGLKRQEKRELTNSEWKYLFNLIRPFTEILDKTGAEEENLRKILDGIIFLIYNGGSWDSFPNQYGNKEVAQKIMKYVFESNIIDKIIYMLKKDLFSC